MASTSEDEKIMVETLASAKEPRFRAVALDQFGSDIRARVEAFQAEYDLMKDIYEELQQIFG